MTRSPQPAPKVLRRYEPRTSHVQVVEIHEIDCGCPACEPYAPSVEPRLTAIDIGKLAAAGCFVGNVIAFAIDPAAAWAALAACVGLG